MLYIAGFVDGVMFSDNGPCGGVTLLQQNAHNVVHGLTHCRLMFCMTVGAKSRHILQAMGAGAEYAVHHSEKIL